MNNSGLEYNISSYVKGRPTISLFFNTLFCYLIPSAILFYAFYEIYIKYWQSEQIPFFQYLSIIILIVGISVLVLGILNLRPTTIHLNKDEMIITVGKKTRRASWFDVEEVRSSIGITLSLGRAVDIDLPVVIIKTNNWKYKTRRRVFKPSDIKELFRQIVERAISNSTVIVDEQGWLPQTMQTSSIIKQGLPAQLRIYYLIKKIGIVIIVLGGVIAIFGLVDILFFNVGGPIVVLGVICILLSLLGIGDEKQKLEKRKNRNKR